MAPSAHAQTGAAPAAAIAEVVVTGSRVIRNGNNSPTPVTIVQADELKGLNPTTITDALNDLPVFQGSRTQTSAPNTTGTYGGGNPASNQLNLRNLGPARTLILFDGQRQPPGNYIGVVDVDLIPQMLIQRVDVVTGGASAVYGSDAISGVVNYVTDKNFNGIKVESQYGISSRKDDETWKAGIAAGMKFGSGGHIEASFQHYSDKGIPRKSDRDYYRLSLVGSTPGSTATQGSVTNPYGSFGNVTSNQNTFGGLIANGALKGQQFSSNGVLSTFNHGLATGSTTAEVGGDGSFSGGESLKAPLRFDQAFVRLDYDLGHSIRFHTEVAYIDKVDSTSSNDASFNNFTFSTANPFLPAAVKAAMGTATTFTMSKRWNKVTSLYQVSRFTGYTINTGLEGDLGKYKWGVDVDYGRTALPDLYQYNVNNQKLAAALDAVVNPANGQTVCNASLTNSAYANCVPLNWFGPIASSQAAMDYVTEQIHYKPWFIQSEVNAHIAGDVFDLPAGPVTAALSGEVRRQTGGGSSDTPVAFANCTGLRFNCTANSTPLQANQFAQIPIKNQTVKEVALEVGAPLLKGVAFAEALNVNGAVRYTSYDFGGNSITWKVGLDWHVNSAITLRATRSRDIEAPILYALFLPGMGSTQGVQDRLTGVQQVVPNTNKGNPNLVSELGDTTTAGIVWRPSFIPRFSLSVDAYHIQIAGALINIQGFNPQVQDACYASKGASYLCTLQSRPLGNYTNTSAANAVSAWFAQWQNASVLETYGIDVEANYGGDLRGHPYTFRVFTTYQPHYLLGQPGTPTFDEGNVAYPNVTPLQDIPAVRLTGSANFGVTDKLFVGLTERYRGGMKASAVPTDFYLPKDQTVKALLQTDFNATYRIKPGDEIFLNIRNAFDRMPPHAPGNSRNPGYPGTDDSTGRYTTVGIRLRY